VDDPKSQSSEREVFLRKKGHPGPAELAPLQGLPGVRRHPGFQERLTRSRGRRKWKPRLASYRLLGPTSGPTSGESVTTGVRGMVQSWPLASQHAESRLTSPRPVQQAPSGCQLGFIPKQDGFRCCTAHSSIRRKSRRANEASESFVSCEVLSLVGVSGFALTRLQNLVSGVWLKRRVSVAAEASGRGLVVGSSNCQRRKDGRKTNREYSSGWGDSSR